MVVHFLFNCGLSIIEVFKSRNKKNVSYYMVLLDQRKSVFGILLMIMLCKDDY